MPLTREKANGQLPSMPILTDNIEDAQEEVQEEEKSIDEDKVQSQTPEKKSVKNCGKSSNFRLAYSSAMSKPVCLCIIWVHLQGSTSTDQSLDTRLHRCMVKRRPKPVSEGHQIVCHRCAFGFSSYSLYLDHLRSSPCGIQQQVANKPRGLNNQTNNHVSQDKKSSFCSPITSTTSTMNQRSSDLIRLANLTHGQSCRSWNTHHLAETSTTSSKKRKLNYNESSYSKFQPNRIQPTAPWVMSGPRYTAAQRYDWPFQMMQTFNHPQASGFCHPSNHFPYPSVNQFSISNPFNFPSFGFGYGGSGNNHQSMQVAQPTYPFQQVSQGFGMWRNEAFTNYVVPNRSDLDLYCNWRWSQPNSQDVFKMSFDREWRERWNQQFSNGQQRTNFATSYNMNNSYQEFSQHQELDIHQNSNENSNFVQESDEFSSMVSQEDLNLLNFGDDNLFSLDDDLALATIEISDVQESELFADSVESNMNGLESIMFGEEISSEGSSEDLIQQAVNVSGMDDIFQLTPDSSDISPEIQNHERDFPGDEINFSEIDTGFKMIPHPVVTPQKYLKESSKDPILTSTASINQAQNLKAVRRCGKKAFTRHDSKSLDVLECPHLSVIHLPPIGASEQAKDQLQLICLQAKLGYVLLGLVGEERLKNYGYPVLSVVQILQQILTTCTTSPFMDEKSCCNNHCLAMDKSLDKDQLTYRFVKLRVQLLRSNILKLLHLCVPSRQKWQEFGWTNKSIDDIMEELTQQDIPKFSLGDSVLSTISKKITKKVL